MFGGFKGKPQGKPSILGVQNLQTDTPPILMGHTRVVPILGLGALLQDSCCPFLDTKVLWMHEILHHFEAMLFVGIDRGIIIQGLLRWCEMDFVHPQYEPKEQDPNGRRSNMSWHTSGSFPSASSCVLLLFFLPRRCQALNCILELGADTSQITNMRTSLGCVPAGLGLLSLRCKQVSFLAKRPEHKNRFMQQSCTGWRLSYGTQVCSSFLLLP